MMLAQHLYEGVDLGNGDRVGLISYMRTDSVRIADQARDAVRDYVRAQYGNEYGPAKARVYKSKAKAQDAHEAIRPTDVGRRVEDIGKALNKDQRVLYELIWRRFVASQMESARYDTTEVTVSAGKYTLRANGRVMTISGFLAVYEERAGGEATALPALEEGTSLALGASDGTQHFTEPPTRFTVAAGISAMMIRGGDDAESMAKFPVSLRSAAGVARAHVVQHRIGRMVTFRTAVQRKDFDKL